MKLENQIIKLENVIIKDNFKKWYQPLLTTLIFVTLFTAAFWLFQNDVVYLIRWIFKTEIPNNFYVENLPFWTKIFEDIKVFFETLTVDKVIDWIDYALFWLLTDGLIIFMLIAEFIVVLGLIYNQYLNADEVENLDEDSRFKRFIKSLKAFLKEAKQELKEFITDYFEEILITLFLLFWPPICIFLGHAIRAFAGMTILGFNDDVIYDESLYTIIIFIPTLIVKLFLKSSTFFKIVEIILLFYFLLECYQNSKIRRLENKHYEKVLKEQRGEHSTTSGIPGSGKTLKTVIDSNIMEEWFFKEILDEKNDIQASNLTFNYHKLEEILEKDPVFAEKFLLFEETQNVIKFDETYIDELKQEIALSDINKFKNEEEFEDFKANKKQKIVKLKEEIKEQKEIYENVKMYLEENYKKIEFENETVKRYLFLDFKMKKSLIFSDFPVISKYQSIIANKLVFTNELTFDELSLKKGEGRRLIEEFYIMVLDEYEVAIGDNEVINNELSKLYSIISHVTKRKYKTSVVTQKRNAVNSTFRVKMDTQHALEEKVAVKFGLYKIIQGLYLSLYNFVKGIMLQLNNEREYHYRSEQFIYRLYNRSLRSLYMPLSKIYLWLKTKLERIEIDKGYFVFSYENLCEIDAGTTIKKSVVKKEKVPCKLAYIKLNGFYYRLYDSVALGEFYQKKGRYEFYVNTSPFLSTAVDRQKFYDEKNLFNGLTKINNDKVKK